MPMLLFTVDEVARGLIERQRKLSAEILDLSDLKVIPLNPGESVADRYHKIAKLGTRLAAAFKAFDEVVEAASRDDAEAEAKPADPAPPSQAN